MMQTFQGKNRRSSVNQTSGFSNTQTNFNQVESNNFIPLRDLLKRNHGDRVKYHLLKLEKENGSNEDTKRDTNGQDKEQKEIHTIDRKKFK